MASTITDEGLEWLADKSIDNESGTIDVIAVGNGDGAVAVNDTSMDSELYRTSTADEDMSISETPSTGVLELEISFLAGLDVPPGSEIGEFGVFTSTNEMIYHEYRAPVTVGDNSKVTFRITLSIARN